MEPATVKVRPLDARDVSGILALDSRIVGRERAPSWQQRVSRYLEMYYPPLGQVAEAEGKIVGFILGDVRGWEYGLRSSGWIDVIGVDPEYQKQGVGQRLVDAFARQCQRQGMPIVNIMVREDDDGLHHFLDSLAFKKGKLVHFEKEM